MAATAGGSPGGTGKWLPLAIPLAERASQPLPVVQDGPWCDVHRVHNLNAR